MPALLYSLATRTQWFANAYPGTSITPNCVVWHTTETGSWPSYSGGASAPHFTYNPAVREIRQHFPVNRSARALRNLSGGVETNTLNVVQIEIVAYSDEVLAARRGHRAVSHLRPEHLKDLGEWARWLHDEWGIRLDIDPGWVTSNYTNPKRMSFAQWRGFYGHTGHNRVPENTHWDPARLDIWTIIDHAKGGEDMSQFGPENWDAADKNHFEAIVNNMIVKYTDKNLAYHLRKTLNAVHVPIRWANGEDQDVAHTLSWLQRSAVTIMESQQGSDAAAILAKLDEVAAADAARDQAVLDAIESLESGDGDAALAKLRDLLNAALTDTE